MEKIVTFAVILSGLFIVVFVIIFLWGVGRQILRWAAIAAAVYAAIVMTVRAAHVGGDAAPTTIADLLSATSGPHCSVAASTTSRPMTWCAKSTK
ncbi:MAG TPA: hypothetical protein VGG01_26325 [Xanthobacteraceae bacterium]|jgi:hypothetical protein